MLTVESTDPADAVPGTYSITIVDLLSEYGTAAFIGLTVEIDLCTVTDFDLPTRSPIDYTVFTTAQIFVVDPFSPVPVGCSYPLDYESRWDDGGTLRALPSFITDSGLTF